LARRVGEENRASSGVHIMTEYTAPTYTAAKVLEMLHNSVRVKGSNEIVLSSDGFTMSQDDPTVEYLIGVSVGPLVCIIMFFVWLIALCAVGCCRQRCQCSNSNKVPAALFVGFMILSCFGWFYSLGSYNQAHDGLNTLLNSGEDLQAYVDSADTTLTAVVTAIDEVSTSVNTSSTVCAAVFNATNMTFPTGEWTLDTNEISGGLDSITSDMDDILDEYNAAMDKADPYVDKSTLGYKIAVGLMIALSIVFIISTLYRLWDNVPGTGTRPAKVLASCSGIVFIVLSVIILLLIWINVAVLAVMSTVGADFCVPSPSTNINRILEEVIDLSTDLCDTEPYSYLCYYQTCEGENPLEGSLDDVINMTYTLQSEIDSLIVQLNDTYTSSGANISDFETCIASMEAMSSEIGDLPVAIDSVVEITSCSNINPLYVKIVNEGLCNNFVAGLAVTWIMLALGSSALMAALLVYRVFEFEKYQQGELITTAQVVATGTKE